MQSVHYSRRQMYYADEGCAGDLKARWVQITSPLVHICQQFLHKWCLVNERPHWRKMHGYWCEICFIVVFRMQLIAVLDRHHMSDTACTAPDVTVNDNSKQNLWWIFLWWKINHNMLRSFAKSINYFFKNYLWTVTFSYVILGSLISLKFGLDFRNSYKLFITPNRCYSTRL